MTAALETEPTAATGPTASLGDQAASAPATAAGRGGAPRGGRLEQDLAAMFARLLPSGSWSEHAACRTSDPEAFFEPASVGAARAVCHRCPVINLCLRWALDTKEAHGVWGGLTDAERAELTSKKSGAAGRRAKALRHAARLAEIARAKEQRMAAIKRAQTPAPSTPERKQRTVPGVLARAAQAKRRRGCTTATITPPQLAYQGDPWFEQRIKVRITPAPPQPGHGDERKPLSQREAEVLDLIADGLSNKQIGEKLGLSPLTVKSHKTRIVDNLGGCGESSHCVALGYAYGYLRPSPQPPGRLLVPTRRPLEVLRLLPEGLRNREIGARLNLTEDTVKSHIARLLKLYGARNRAHLVDITFRTGLFVPVLGEGEVPA